jgi:hypothetical protein
VKQMNPEDDDAVIFNRTGMIANAKVFLDENDRYIDAAPEIRKMSDDENKPIYIIGNARHRLGFMVVSPDDPLGYSNPAEAISELGQMRQDYGTHLKLYQVIPVTSPVTTRTQTELHNQDIVIDGFDYSLIEEYIHE